MKNFLLALLFLVFGVIHIDAQRQNPVEKFIGSGSWIFEKAEYAESSAQTKPYTTKSIITNAENLQAFSLYSPMIAYSLDFFGDYVSVSTLCGEQIGRWQLSTFADNENKGFLDVGMQEIVTDDNIDNFTVEIEPGIECNAFGLHYTIEIIDENTMSITTEFICDDKPAIIKSIMKKL